VPLLDASIDTLAEESNPDEVGPSDVADVYDAYVLLSDESPSAQLTLHDGTQLELNLRTPPEVAPQQRLPFEKVELSATGDSETPAVQVRSTSPRRIHWHIAIARPNAASG